VVFPTQVVEHRQANGDEDAPLDSQEYDGQRRANSYGEGHFAESVDLPERPDVDQLRADEEDDGGQCRYRQPLDGAGGDQQDSQDQQGGYQLSYLRASTGRLYHGCLGRAAVDDEGAG